MLEMNITDVD
jgi:hypothetical protein